METLRIRPKYRGFFQGGDHRTHTDHPHRNTRPRLRPIRFEFLFLKRIKGDFSTPLSCRPLLHLHSGTSASLMAFCLFPDLNSVLTSFAWTLCTRVDIIDERPCRLAFRRELVATQTTHGKRFLLFRPQLTASNVNGNPEKTLIATHQCNRAT